MLTIQEIRKNPDGIHFEQQFDVTEELKTRNPEILDLKAVFAQGRVQYEDGLYLLDYRLSYTITLASSRSMEPVAIAADYSVHELFAQVDGNGKHLDVAEDELILPLEQDEIDLTESVTDNILLHIPLKVLTPEEEASDQLPAGEDWQVMTEEDYAQAQELKKEENSPFAGLQGFFDDE